MAIPLATKVLVTFQKDKPGECYANLLDKMKQKITENRLGFDKKEYNYLLRYYTTPHECYCYGEYL